MAGIEIALAKYLSSGNTEPVQLRQKVIIRVSFIKKKSKVYLYFKGLEVRVMTTNQFILWVQESFDSCNIHNEIETSKLIVEVMREFYSLTNEQV